MTPADWVILAIVVVAVVQAAISGFFGEAFNIAGLVVGYLLAAWQYERVANWLLPYLKSPWLGEILGFFLIFTAVMVLAGLIGKLARHLMKAAGLTFYDRVLGGLLGSLKGALLAAVLLLSVTTFAPASKWLAGSTLAPYFLVVGRAAIWLAPSDLRARFYQGLDLLHRVPQVSKTASATAEREPDK